MASLSREIQLNLLRNAPTPHLFFFSEKNSVCSAPLSLAVTNGIIKKNLRFSGSQKSEDFMGLLFSFPAGTKMFQFPAYAFSVNFLAELFQIRTFWDQNLRAIPPDFSQLATSFLAIQAKLSL